MTIDSKKISNKTSNKLYDAEIHNGNKVQPARGVFFLISIISLFGGFIFSGSGRGNW